MQYARKRFLLFRRPLLYCVQPQLYLRRTGQPNLPPVAQWRKLVLQIRPRKLTRPRRNQKSRQQIHYFHCDQIGIPREIANKDGNLVWGLLWLGQTEERNQRNGCRCIIGKRYMYRKMPGNTIVDGNHRMVAGLLCNQIPASTPGTAPLSKPRIPLKDI